MVLLVLIPNHAAEKWCDPSE